MTTRTTPITITIPGFALAETAELRVEIVNEGAKTGDRGRNEGVIELCL